MKNSINCFATLLLLLCSLSGNTQEFKSSDTIWFDRPNSYSRAICRWGKELVIGTSNDGVIAINEKTRKVRQLIPATKGAEIRDVEVFNDKLYAMTAGDIGIVFEVTKDSVRQLINAPGMFFDDISVANNELIVLGDPVNGAFYLKRLNLNGELTNLKTIPTLPQEACYAASGKTGQIVDGRYCFVSGGGKVSRFHSVSLSDTTDAFTVELPMVAGEGAGPFAMYFTSPKHGVIVGGNYMKPLESNRISLQTLNESKTWITPKVEPKGYRSGVIGTESLFFCCGTNGIDISSNNGGIWMAFAEGNFCALLLEKKTLYATSNKGYCIRYEL